MKKYCGHLKSSALFKNLNEYELASILNCLNPQNKTYSKDEFILLAGDPIKYFGIILTGKVHILKEDMLGNNHLLQTLSDGDLFAEVFVCAHIDTIPYSIYAASNCEVMFIDYQKILTPCSSICKNHALLIENIITILSHKSLLLTQKLDYLTRKTTREKLLAYLNDQVTLTSKHKFTIPFNRQELADYLSVDRSAMSNELSKLREEGHINFHKNEFEIIKHDNTGQH